jgi:ribosomal 50S subunit-associated protein YjgA (DUF615 family)
MSQCVWQSGMSGMSGSRADDNKTGIYTLRLKRLENWRGKLWTIDNKTGIYTLRLKRLENWRGKLWTDDNKIGIYTLRLKKPHQGNYHN